MLSKSSADHDRWFRRREWTVEMARPTGWAPASFESNGRGPFGVVKGVPRHVAPSHFAVLLLLGLGAHHQQIFGLT